MSEIVYFTGTATESEKDAFCELVFRAQQDTAGAVRSPAQIRACFDDDLAAGARYAAAYDGERLIGVVFGCEPPWLCDEFDVPARTFYCSDVAVDPAYRRRRIGNTLLLRLSEHVATESYRYMFAHVAAGSRNVRTVEACRFVPHETSGGRIGYLMTIEPNPISDPKFA